MSLGSVVYVLGEGCSTETIPEASNDTSAPGSRSRLQARCGSKRSRISTYSRSADTLNRAGGKLVFVGSNWHRLGWRTGSLSDFHSTPAGLASGVFERANYAEAIPGGNYYWPAHEWFASAVEILVLLPMAIVFAIEMNIWKKMVIVLAASVLFYVGGLPAAAKPWNPYRFLIPLVFLLPHVLRTASWSGAGSRW